MVMLNVRGKELYEDKTWLRELDIFLDAMKDNDDLVIVFSGAERSGKSFRIRQVAAYCAQKLGSTFTPDNIHFELNEYIDFSLESPQYTVCVLDEGRNVLNKKNSTSKVNKKFTNYISECAKKRQVHIIALPAFHDLDRYISLWRMKFNVLMHKWYKEDSSRESGYSLGRGAYTLHMNDDYLKDSYNYPYRYPKRFTCKGKYSNVEVFTEKEVQEYENKKDVGLDKKYHSKHEDAELGKRDKMWQQRWFNVVEGCKNNRGITLGELSDYSQMELKTMKETLSRLRVV